MSRNLIIWGCGGHGREVSHLCEQIGIEVVGFLDERPHMKGVVVDGVPVLGDITDILPLRGKVPVFCGGVGDPALKRHFFEKSMDSGFGLASALIHPGVYLSKRSHIGPGTMVAEGCILTVNVDVDAHVTLNRSVNLGHDVRIGKFATLSPGVVVSGNVDVGEGAYLGTGCIIREKIQIGAWSEVGGGAFVAKPVISRTLVVGVPAAFKKDL
ncbi:acetyltransferase [Geothrix edaphica]|nr:acetyltransferase [Geothrix edaphica]